MSNNKIGHCIAFSVFSGLNEDKPMAQRLSAAKLIAKDLPADPQYLPLIVDCLSKELDEKVKDYLIDFLNKYSSNDFYNFFKSTDLEIKK